MIGPISYVGGKNRLASKIIALFPEHTTYVEPFSGGAQVFFRKAASKVEVLNDLDSEVINFYRVCQWHHAELVRFLKFWPASRKLHEWMTAATPALLTDIQRAARFLYLQKNSFGGLVVRQRFHYGVIQRPNYNPGRLPEIIERAHERLRNVQLECLPYEQVLLKYDRPTTLFYLDPPYWQRRLYKHNMTPGDFQTLEQRLSQLSGKFILSLDDNPKVRRLFRRWIFLEARLSYTAQKTVGKFYRELLILNFQPPTR